MRGTLAFILVVVLAAAGCGSEETTTLVAATETSAEGLPGPVVETRAAILSAAEAGDYEQLRAVLKPEVFLSDYGFGNDQRDPIAAWAELGSRPLETMDALLRMRHFVRETNEGTLYHWPRLDPDSAPEDMTPEERELFLTFMSEEELGQAFNPDYGYTAPRLGILADGTWWFFIAEPGP
jgi:hypothetical protein